MSEYPIQKTQSLPLPDGYKKFIVISKKPPKQKHKKEIEAHHYKSDIAQTLSDLQSEIATIVNTTKQLQIECSSCCNGISIKDCFKFKSKAKIKDNKVSV